MKGILHIVNSMGVTPVAWNTCSTTEYEANDSILSSQQCFGSAFLARHMLVLYVRIMETVHRIIHLSMTLHIYQPNEFLCSQTQLLTEKH